MSELPEGAVQNSDGTVSYKLSYPIKTTLGGRDETVDLVTVRRKRMADNLAIEDHSKNRDFIKISATLIERLTGLHAAQVAMLDDVDSEAIGSIIEGFTMPGRATGSSASAS
jgi:hypothetical protein